MSLQVKICGVTRPEDAALAAELGATHVSCVIAADSPWHTPPALVREIAHAAGKRVKVVLSFRNATVEVVTEMAKLSGTKAVQVAGLKEPDIQILEKGGLVVYRVHEVPTGSNMLPPLVPEPTEKSPAILQVTATVTGLTFPWEILGAEAPHATFIAGGVRPENVCALLTHNPWGIAVNTGVEVEPGIKNRDRMAMLFETIENAL